MKLLTCLLFFSINFTFIFFKIDKTERCLIYQTKKDSELLIILKLQDFEKNKNSSILVIIKDDNTEYHKIKRYLMKNTQKQSFIYHSISDQEFFICLSSKEQLFASVQIKQYSPENKKILSIEQFSSVENKIKDTIFNFKGLKNLLNENKIQGFGVLKVFLTGKC